VDEITYSPKMQKESGQKILIITERCVFKIENNQITLIEVANGVDLKNDILDQMEFEPQIINQLES
jgi:propionate CoA-transferase